MRSIPEGAHDPVESPLWVGDAGAWDILFLVSEIAAGAERGHFSPRMARPGEQRSLALRLAKALLSRRWPFRHYFKPAMFLAARHGKSTIGVAFASHAQASEGSDSVSLDYVAVDRSFHNRGVGTALVRAVLDQIPAGTKVHCLCAPASRAMEHVVAHFGFKCAHKAVPQCSLPGPRIVLPAHWVKQL